MLREPNERNCNKELAVQSGETQKTVTVSSTRMLVSAFVSQKTTFTIIKDDLCERSKLKTS